MSNNRNIWERIPFDADEPDPMKAELPDVEAELQRKIDGLCKHFTASLMGVEPTGELLGRIARTVTEAVGRTVVVTVVPMGVKGGVQLAGYALPSPPVPKPLLKEPEVNTDRLTEEQRRDLTRQRAVERPRPTMGVPAAPRREDPGVLDADRLEELFRGRTGR